jgi:hypothetical protein
MQFLGHFLLADGFLPRIYYYVPTPGLRGMQVLPDSPIAPSDFSIPRQIRNEPAELSE